MGRAVGNSGDDDPGRFPDIDRKASQIERQRLTYADNRSADPDPNVKNGPGFNGFAIMTLEGRVLTVEYYAVGPSGIAEVILSEAFELDDSGDISDPRVAHSLKHPDFIARALST